MKNETLKTIFENAFSIAINMNDTFYYACADAAIIDTQELEDLEPVIEKYNYKAFVAYEALRRGHDPQIPKNADTEFKEAKQMIQDIMNKATEYGEFFELREIIQEAKALEAKERKKLSKKKSKLKNWFSFFYGKVR